MGLSKIMPDYVDGSGRWRKTIRVNKVPCWTLSGQLWSAMRKRCVQGGEFQIQRPTYSGCVVSEEFEDFQSFCNWHRSQIGYGLGYQLDKDLLVEGNKIYSAEQCVLIPRQLNSFCTASQRTTNLPRGVSFSSGKYRSAIEFLGTTRSLGYYWTPDEAAEAYKEAKEFDAKRWADLLCPPDYFVEQRVIDRLRVWTFPKDM